MGADGEVRRPRGDTLSIYRETFISEVRRPHGMTTIVGNAATQTGRPNELLSFLQRRAVLANDE